LRRQRGRGRSDGSGEWRVVGTGVRKIMGGTRLIPMAVKCQELTPSPFHSGAGAVPVRLTHKPQRPAFLFGLVEEIPEAKAVQVIERFVRFLRQSECAAFMYIQESDLPIILSYATDGTYHRALASVDDMEVLVKRLSHEWEQAANMDW